MTPFRPLHPTRARGSSPPTVRQLSLPTPASLSGPSAPPLVPTRYPDGTLISYAEIPGVLRSSCLRVGGLCLLLLTPVVHDSPSDLGDPVPETDVRVWKVVRVYEDVGPGAVERKGRGRRRPGQDGAEGAFSRVPTTHLPLLNRDVVREWVLLGCVVCRALNQEPTTPTRREGRGRRKGPSFGSPP